MSDTDPTISGTIQEKTSNRHRVINRHNNYIEALQAVINDKSNP